MILHFFPWIVVELTRSHQNNDRIAFHMITDDSLGNGRRARLAQLMIHVLVKLIQWED